MPDPPKKPTGNLVYRFCGGIHARRTVRPDDSQAEKEAQSSWAIKLKGTVRRRFDVAAPSVPPPVALPTSDSGPVAPPLTIRLSDGSSLDIDADEWPTLANPVGAMDVGPHAIEHLFVGKYDDGRTLVYVVIEQSGTLRTIAGEMLPADVVDIQAAVRRLAARFDISTQLVDQCLDSFKRSSIG